MACFAVPVVEAVVVTVIRKVAEKKEKSPEKIGYGKDRMSGIETKIPFTRKLKWLANLLWGGSALLAFEHVWHGEVVPWFPFLTAMNDPADTAEMLHEMSTVGVSMAALVTLVWVGMLFVSSAVEKRTAKTGTAEA